MKKKSIILLTVLSALLVIVFSASGIWLSQSLFDNPINYLTFSKGDSYEDVWKRVQHFEKKGLPKSALALVDSIYLQAKVDSNHAQYVKALVHKMKYTSRIEEDATKKIIIQLQNEADSSFFPLKPVLHSMMAEMYWMYYQQNSWTILNRTETVGFIPDDIATWDLKRLVDAVIKNYLASLENADSLKRTRIDLYDDVLYYQPGSRKFRPSLYDFLAHRAVDYFRSYEPDIARPADRFTIAGKEYFCPARDFTKLEIKTADTLSLKYYAVKILQDLLAFHIDDDSAEVWIDADLKRLQLMKDHSVEPDKDSLYLEALLALEKKAWELPIYTEVAYSIGNEYYQRGALYQPLASEENKWMYK
ncbi:MAG: hypothetical protein KJ607_13680, partial [Bacteroidetes bacterium]|nr:hypothetical protein [Bacteroidota bacterium]